MASVTFITPEQKRITINHAVGSLMEIATHHDVEGIEGACGGVCSCATCHVKIPAAWQEKVGTASDGEKAHFDFMDNAAENSRLCCQIEMSEALDGLEVEVAGEEG